MHGYECVGSVLDLPDGIDVAMLMLRADLVPQAVHDCGERGISFAVVLSSGFEDSEAAAELNVRAWRFALWKIHEHGKDLET